MELKALLENEAEANQYAAKCLAVCAGVGTLAWLFNILGIFIIPANIMNIGMPFTILFFLIPTLLCKITRRQASLGKVRNCHLRHYKHLYSVRRHA